MYPAAHTEKCLKIPKQRDFLAQTDFTAAFSSLKKYLQVYNGMIVCVWAHLRCISSRSQARCDLFLIQFYRTRLANAERTYWNSHPIAHSLPFSHKKCHALSLWKEMTPSADMHWLVWKLNLNLNYSNNPVIFLLYSCNSLLWSFKRERPWFSWGLWRQVNVAFSEPALIQTL